MILQSVIANISSHPFWTVFIHVASLIGFILGIVLITQILRNPRKPSATIGWLLIIVLVPLLGIPLYLTFGDRKFNKQKQKKGFLPLPKLPKENDHQLNILLMALGLPSSCNNNSNKFHQDGLEAWQALVSLLENAQHSIDMSMFILADDVIGQKVLSILETKASKGLKIRVLLDGVGSFHLAKQKLQILEQNGGEISWFIPVLHKPFRGRTNLRNHRKIIIADGFYATAKVWTGGRNLAQEYLGENCPKDCWIDLSMTQSGSVVQIYQAIFDADWSFACHLKPKQPSYTPVTKKQGNSQIQIIPSGPDVADDPIYVAILTACYSAKKNITIVTPYYIPNSEVQEALKLAALRGVKVHLILPKKSNHYFADVARKRYLRILHKVGVEIFLIANKMVHAKAIVIDDSFAMTGSANLDIRSLFLNCEIMSGFYSTDDIQWLSNWLTSLEKQGEHHKPKEVGALQEIYEGVILLGSFQL